MVQRDQEKFARNIKISTLTTQLKEMFPQVLEETKTSNEQSLHAYFATRKAQYIDLKHLVTPKFRNGSWVNGNSEIRRFRKRYWSIGHILQTGLARSLLSFSDEEIKLSSNSSTGSLHKLAQCFIVLHFKMILRQSH
ncbi:hypothetical protein BN59_02106 [Legionella massiliensis]|uniref:Uncharacterized protein n=1 Tax=Legionella massiliensis TaxID=1034943 RepID=A0A078KXX8_9GAMM|nr:hypothetical protein [Legionella massiliensis]CDZ77816.1 hypothetical protein BN59_02106 [Legionella massiliensis]CEE13554.1 hypothetical protein BN1094_02106 [Legionella massiliensis]